MRQKTCVCFSQESCQFLFTSLERDLTNYGTDRCHWDVFFLIFFFYASYRFKNWKLAYHPWLKNALKTRGKRWFSSVDWSERRVPFLSVSANLYYIKHGEVWGHQVNYPMELINSIEIYAIYLAANTDKIHCGKTNIPLVSSLRSKRFRLVSEQRNTDFGRARNETRAPFFAQLTLVPRSLLLNRTQTLATQAIGILPSVVFLSVSFRVALLFYGMFRINLWIAYRQMNKKDTLRSPKQKIPSAT